MIGTLAIAGIPPFAGFFSKDEILFRAFLAQQGRSGCSAVATALMTAFYMFRLMAMTFFGGYRGPAWETRARAAAVAAAAVTARRIRPTRTRTARRTSTDHEVTHGPADAARRARRCARRPRPRPVARAARIADADDVPADGAGRRRDRRRLRRHSGRARRRQRDRALPRAELHRASASAEPERRPRERRRLRRRPANARSTRSRMPRAASSSGLMGFSVLIAVVGILLARKFYVDAARRFPSGSREQLRRRASPAVEQVLRRRALQRDGHRAARWRSGRGLWTFDRTRRRRRRQRHRAG